MTTILTIFGLSLLLSFLLTPAARMVGARFGAMDLPDYRKAHDEAIARTGGIALFLSFYLTLLFSKTYVTAVTELFVFDERMLGLLAGSLIVFGTGLWDDFRRLDYRIKFLMQIVGVTVAFWGGVRIETLPVLELTIHSEILSYGLTVFWFLLFINAVNLIDGLDGLAAGITFFTAAVLIIISVLAGNYLNALFFASLSGTVLGFLYYNFNPATIFMGDGGSYFLGYTIAGLSILGSVKSQVGVAMMTPVIALGLPVFDAILSPVRRFIVGESMFGADGKHIHHRLVAAGLTTRKAVLTLYLITIVLCLLSLILLNVRNETAGFVLAVTVVSAIVFIRKLGYLRYVSTDNLFSWVKGVGDEAGFTKDRRSFLRMQIDISDSKDLHTLWNNICNCLEMLKIDLGELYLYSIPESKDPACSPESQNGSDSSPTSVCLPGDCTRETDGTIHCKWTRNGFKLDQHPREEHLLKLELPLMNHQGETLGRLWLVKDLKEDSIGHYSLKRLEHLRRGIIHALAEM
jgi:UDP-GlcNAc:undecaprenyl-phosphate GlcNAc-1-phosphate transferase